MMRPDADRMPVTGVAGPRTSPAIAVNENAALRAVTWVGDIPP